MSVIKAMVSLLTDGSFAVSGEGGWQMRHQEKVALEAVANHLDNPLRSQLRKLLTLKMFIQRSGPRVVWPRFYNSSYVRIRTPLAFLDNDSRAYEVVLDVDGRREKTHVEFFHGEIETIQFRKPAAFYVGKAVRAVEVREIDPSLTNFAQMDREEHGDE